MSFENSPLKFYRFGGAYKTILNALLDLRNSISHHIFTVYSPDVNHIGYHRIFEK